MHLRLYFTFVAKCLLFQ